MKRKVIFILILAFGCSNNSKTSQADLSFVDVGNDASEQDDIDTWDSDVEPDVKGEECDENFEESCLNLGFYGGSLKCNDGLFDTSECLKCSSHETTSRESLSEKWTKTGPPGANVRALLALENNVVLAGTGRTRARAGGAPIGYAAGIYRSTDGGKNFTLQKSFFENSGTQIHNFSRVGNTKRIYATLSASNLEENGVWMSDDAGISWVDVSAGLFDSARPRWVQSAPGQDGGSDVVYLTVEGTPADPRAEVHSLYRRQGDGPWTLLPANGTEGELALALAVVNQDTIFLASKTHFFRSENGGQDFVAKPFGFSNPTTSTFIPRLVFDPLNSDRVFRTTENFSLVSSSDGGESWTELGLGFGQNDFVLKGDKIFVATRSSGLQQIREGSLESIGNCLLTPDPTAVAIAPDDPNKIYVGYDGQGVLHSDDGGQSFTPQGSGIDELVAKVMVTGDVASSKVWILSSAGLFLSIDTGDTWKRIADNQGMLAFNSVAQDPTNPNRILAGTNDDWYAGGGRSGGAFDVDLENDRITPLLGFSGVAPSINSIAFDPSDANILYVYQDKGERSDGGETLIYVSKDSGKTFQSAPIAGESFTGSSTCSGNLFSISVTGIPYFCSRPVGTDRAVSIYTSTDKGATFDILWSGEGSLVDDSKPYFPYSGMYIDAEETLYFAGAGAEGLAILPKGEDSFSDFGVGLGFFASQVWDMAFSPNGEVLLATSDGAYFAKDGSSFVALNDGFENLERNPRAHSTAFLPGSNVAFVATSRGVFRRHISE